MSTTTIIANARLRDKEIGNVLFKYGAQFKIRWAKKLHGDVDMVISRLGVGIKLLMREDTKKFSSSKFKPSFIELQKSFRFSFVVCVGIDKNVFFKVQESLHEDTQICILEQEMDILGFLIQLCTHLCPEKLQRTKAWFDEAFQTSISKQSIRHICEYFPIAEPQVLLEIFGSLQNLSSVDVTALMKRTPLSAEDAMEIARFLLE